MLLYYWQIPAFRLLLYFFRTDYLNFESSLTFLFLGFNASCAQYVCAVSFCVCMPGLNGRLERK